MNDFHDGLPEDFDRELTLLHEAHAPIEPIELDRVRGIVRARAARRRPDAWRHFVRSRVAVVAAITVGGLMSSGATALGISGLASDTNANIAQYGQPLGGGVTKGNGAGNTTPASGVSPNSRPAHAVAPEQETAQAGPSTTGVLPFTGWAVVPVLLVGVTLLAAGLLGRRVAMHDKAPPS